MNVRSSLLGFSVIVLLSGGAAAQTDTLFLDRWHVYRQGIVGLYDLEGNFNPGRYKWSLLTPSRIQTPALSRHIDPNRIQPLPEVPVRSEMRKLSNLIYGTCYDSDRCEFLLLQTQTPTEKRILIRLAGIHTPHLDASCEQETILGEQAKGLIHGYLSSAVHIELRNFTQKGREIAGRLFADGQDLSEFLVNQGLAVGYGGTKKDWCS